MANKPTDPWFASRVLSGLIRESIRHGAVGDFSEQYHWIRHKNGRLVAWMWYWFQIVQLIPESFYHQIHWGIVMVRNYFKIAMRNIEKHKYYALINILGLAIGMACCILISLWVIDELHYNRFHEKIDTVYGAVNDQYFEGNKWHINNTPTLLGPALEQDFPEIKATTRYQTHPQALLTFVNKSFFENRIYLVDPSFLQMFSFPLISGDQNTALDNPNSIILTTHMAEKYFAGENPLGKTILLNNETELIVTGVMENVPHNSTLTFHALIPYRLYEDARIRAGHKFHWFSNHPRTFIELHSAQSAEVVNEKIHHYVREKAGDDRAPLFHIVSLKDFRFSPYYGGTGRVNQISVLALIALFILLIACINFMNLSTARSMHRAKEIGLRKVVGASRKNLVLQFLGESLLLAFSALLMAMVLVVVLLPTFNQVFGKNLPLSILKNTFVSPVLFGITLLTGMAGGSYPAILLSSFKPVSTLKGSSVSAFKRKDGRMRKILVVFQFVLSIALIISTLVIYKQTDYIRNANLGYEKEHIVYLPLRSGSRNYYEALKNKLQNDARILNVTGSTHRPSWIGSNSYNAEWDRQEKPNEILIHVGRVDCDYVETMQIELLEGSEFSRSTSQSNKDGFLVNEEMIKLMGGDKGVGSRLKFQGVDGKILGVMKNYHFTPLNKKIPPLALLFRSDRLSNLIVRISAYDIPSSIQILKESWESVVKDYPFEYRFLDSDFDRFYRDEVRIGNIMKSFAILAIFIASLGLFGLASFTAEQRTKEIGIRKILGASVPTVIGLLSKEFTKCIIIANVIAWPVAYFVMNRWLQNYAYRMKLGIWLFVISGVLTLFIALLTVSVQSIKGATANPVDSLRYE